MRAWPWILGAVAIYAAGFFVFVANLPRASAAPKPAQGIVALTGGDERVTAAVALLESGTAGRLLISGVHPQTTKLELKRLAHGGMRFDCCADLGYAAENTHGNAEEAASWARTHRFKSLIVVTANYHMPRSLAEFESAMPGVRLEPYPVDDIDLDGWWHNPHALRVLQGEYAKYLAAKLRSAVYRPALDAAPERSKPRSASL
ncbi:MAG: YdcF family protein [Alphaproteobacteria bacterium]|nr:YdcF family protein [Alphaproteobacteria bacterium]MBV9694797.1 YdcF family protein [Alphaproteobacteria bacterium]